VVSTLAATLLCAWAQDVNHHGDMAAPVTPLGTTRSKARLKYPGEFKPQAWRGGLISTHAEPQTFRNWTIRWRKASTSAVPTILDHGTRTRSSGLGADRSGLVWNESHRNKCRLSGAPRTDRIIRTPWRSCNWAWPGEADIHGHLAAYSRLRTSTRNVPAVLNLRSGSEAFIARADVIQVRSSMAGHCYSSRPLHGAGIIGRSRSGNFLAISESGSAGATATVALAGESHLALDCPISRPLQVAAGRAENSAVWPTSPG